MTIFSVYEISEIFYIFNMPNYKNKAAIDFAKKFVKEHADIFSIVESENFFTVSIKEQISAPQISFLYIETFTDDITFFDVSSAYRSALYYEIIPKLYVTGEMQKVHTFAHLHYALQHILDVVKEYLQYIRLAKTKDLIEKLQNI